MPQIINTNISSLNSQRHLNNTQSALSTALERLSSGKRINSAKDDAAGLGISERMTSQIRGMNQAIRNARDGISLSQTAEGALATSGDMLQRIRELAVQSSNATNASLDRQALQDEVTQLAAEPNRIAQTTTFNGQKLLDGTMGTQHFQVGANANELISANGTNFLTNTYGDNRIKANAAAVVAGVQTGAAGAFAVRPAAANDFEMPELTINGYLGSAKVTVDTAGTRSAMQQAALVNEKTGETGVKASAKTEAALTLQTGKAYAFQLQSDNATPITISFSVGDKLDADGYAAGINAFNAQSAKTGVMAEYKDGAIKLSHAAGNDVMIANTLVTADTGTVAFSTYNYDGTKVGDVTLAAATADGKLQTGFAKGVVTYDSENSFSLSAAAGSAATKVFSFGISNEATTASATAVQTGSSKLHAVSDLDVTTFENAQLALAIVDGAINSVNKERARYGALQARFEATISNLEVNSENTSNARSRIQDADYAQETAELSRASILQQAGTAMLAQANQMPQTVLSLIG